MGWSLRVLRHRAAAQRTLLATVVAVALVGASLLGTFALLLFTSEHRALDTALDRAPATATDIDVVLPRRDKSDPADAIAAGKAFLDDLLGDVPATRTTVAHLPDVPADRRRAAACRRWPTWPPTRGSRRTPRCVAGAWPTAGDRRPGPRRGRRPEGRRRRVRLDGRHACSRAEPEHATTDSAVVVVGIHELDRAAQHLDP